MILRLLLLVLFLSCLSPAAQAQEALLMGFRVREAATRALPGVSGRDSLVQAGYRSLLVYHEDAGRYRGLAGSGLLMQTGRGLVRIGARRSRYNNWGEDFIWAARPGEVPEYTGISAFNGEYCNGYRSQEILFAGGRYVAVETHTAGYCEGSASPWNFNTLAFLPLDSLADDGLDIAAVLGSEGAEALGRGASEFLRRLPGARRDLYLPEADPANWAVVRRQGRWALIGRLEPIEIAGSAHVADFELPIAPPAALVGRQGTMRWEAIREAVRDAQDAFVSPSGALVAVRRPGLITVHPVQNGRIGSAVVGHPFPEGAAVVSVQWLDARGAQTVRQVLRGRGAR